MQRLAGPAIPLLVGLGFTLLGWTNRLVGGALVGVGILWTVLVLTPVASRLPSVAIRRHGRGEGVSLSLRPPEGGVRRRLRRRTEQLVSRMHDYLDVQPKAGWTESIEEHSRTTRAMQAAASEGERSAIWDAYTHEHIERSARERQELARRFGADVRYVLTEYERLGMIDGSDASRIQWYTQSNGWLHEAATELGALAHRL